MTVPGTIGRTIMHRRNTTQYEENDEMVCCIDKRITTVWLPLFVKLESSLYTSSQYFLIKPSTFLSNLSPQKDKSFSLVDCTSAAWKKKIQAIQNYIHNIQECVIICPRQTFAASHSPRLAVQYKNVRCNFDILCFAFSRDEPYKLPSRTSKC
jgi:hypothetical protein